MLRSILYDILDQHETFFYHCFQSEYRRQVALQERGRGDLVEWRYESFQKILLSLRDHSSAKRLYLIIDAVDESDDKDRRDILELLFRLCSETKYCVVKVFVASRPVAVLERRIGEFHNFIRLQDETKSDISKFASSFLERLEFTGFLEQATEYIVKHAQGVFLWVHLVREELLAYDEQGRAEADVFEFLKSLPTELEEFYQRMLDKIGMNRTDLRDGVKMFRFVLFAYRPLTAGELLHALSIPDNPDIKFSASEELFQKRIPQERYITHCGGNFLEIKQRYGTTTSYEDSSISQANESTGNRSVQVMHQTVREFFLCHDGYVANSKFRMNEKDAHTSISITCIRYLMLYTANMAKGTLDIKSWTSEHFESYAQYLNERPLANYALCYLKRHIDCCCGDANVLRLASQFIDELTCDRAVYLLERWVSSHLNKTRLSSEEGDAAEVFRNKTLHAAARKGFLQATEALLMAGADADSRVELGRTPLLWAARGGHEAVVKALLATGKAAANAEDRDRRTPLLWAAQGGHEGVVKALLATGTVAADAKDRDGRTPLSWAARNGHEAVVKLLLAKDGVDLDSKDTIYGQTPLSWAARNGHEAMVKLLLAKDGVDPDSKDANYGQTPLSWAARNGHEAVVKLLQSHGALSL